MAVHHGDCRQIVPTIGTVDAVVCDPPYDLVAMTKRFGKGHAAAKSPDHQRFARGFMGQTWDGTGVAFDPETWQIVGEALRPGGFLVAFGGTRTYHKMATAIEAAGFTIQDCLMFLFATGFPKRRDMLKPAYEPIVLAYKPGGKRTLQVDECRVGTADDLSTHSRGEGYDGPAFGRMNGLPSRKQPGQEIGRWPANICHDGSDEVVGLFPQSESQSGGTRGTSQIWGQAHGEQPRNGFDDAGSAARFFFSAKAGSQDRWGSRHPTVKPVELMKWLVALVTPPGGTVLDPFAGSGTTGVAALATGRDCILIEREDRYVADIRERLAFYEGGGTHSVQAKNRNRKVDHGPLFDLSGGGSLNAETPPAVTDESYNAHTDSLESYNDAIRAIGERVKQGGPVPEFMRGKR